jgi:hypothetical protein
MRSASGPNTSAPIIRPNKPALKTGPSATLPFLGERRRDIAYRGGIEAIEKQDRRADQQQLDLKGADRLCVDERGDVDGRGIFGRRAGHARSASFEKPAICL